MIHKVVIATAVNPILNSGTIMYTLKKRTTGALQNSDMNMLA